MRICISCTGNPLDQPLPLNSDFWDKKSQYYSHGGSSDEGEQSTEQVIVERLQPDEHQKTQRLEAQLELIAPVVDQAQRKWAELADLDHLNFTAIEWEIENELPEPNDRTWRKGRERGRGARGLPAFLGNAVKLFDLKQVVKELETSVMTSVSCSACKAGKYNVYNKAGIILLLAPSAVVVFLCRNGTAATSSGTRYLMALFVQVLVSCSITWIQESQRTRSSMPPPNFV